MITYYSNIIFFYAIFNKLVLFYIYALFNKLALFYIYDISPILPLSYSIKKLLSNLCDRGSNFLFMISLDTVPKIINMMANTTSPAQSRYRFGG